MELSPQQQTAVDYAKSGLSFVLAGGAGTGKSKTIQHIEDELTAMGRRVAVTALTGQAASLLPHGRTLHSMLNLPVQFGKEASSILTRLALDFSMFDEDRDVLIDACVQSAAVHTADLLCKYPEKLESVCLIDALIVDEVSMLSMFQFMVIDRLFRYVNRNHANVPSDIPFGGKQIICVGDMLQLPPVKSKGALSDDITSKSFFQAKRLFDAVFGNRVIVLTVNYRQQDVRFQELLWRVARGCVTPGDIELLQSRVVRSGEAVPPNAIRIFSRNKDVDGHNATTLSNLITATKCKVHTYTRLIHVAPIGNTHHTRIQLLAERAKGESNVPETIHLCEGAQVMLTANINIKLKLVNGTTAVIVGFSDTGDPMIVTHANYAKYSSGTACSQEELAYKTPESSPEEIAYIMTRVLTVWPVTTTTTEYDVAEIAITQMPLRLMWAITSHKAQGMGVPSLVARLDSYSYFEAGMVYTVLSRVKTLDGLFIEGPIDTSVLTRSNAPSVAFYANFTQV